MRAAAARPSEPSQDLEIRPSRQVRIEGRLLHEPGDVPQGQRVALVEAVPAQLDRSRVRSHEPEQHPQQRRLAGAVGTEQAAHLAFGEGQVDAVDRQCRPKSLGQAARAHHRRAAQYRVSANVTHSPPAVPLGASRARKATPVTLC